MATFNYLWKNRVSFSLKSLNFYRSWTKRVLTLPELVTRNYRRYVLIRHGASINQMAEIGTVNAEGPKRNLTVGSLTFIGQAHLALHDKITIGNNVCINDGVRILTASHDVMDPDWGFKKSPIVIEDYVWIGIGAMILPGVTLGRGAVVGAGAVVTKSVASRNIVVGNPAHPLTKLRIEEFSYNPCEFLAGNRAWLIG